MNKQEKLIVLVPILTSFITFLNVSIVNVALPSVQREFGDGLGI